MKKIFICLALAIALTTCALYSASAGSALSTANGNDPSVAAKGLYEAYQTCNRAAALKVATPATVTKLFGKKCKAGDAGWEFSDCEPTGSGSTCSFRYEGGGVSMRVAKIGNGYRVVSVRFTAD